MYSHILSALALGAAFVLGGILATIAAAIRRDRRNDDLSRRLVAVIAERNLAADEVRRRRIDCDVYKLALVEHHREIEELRAQLTIARDGVPL